MTSTLEYISTDTIALLPGVSNQNYAVPPQMGHQWLSETGFCGRVR